MLNGTRELVLLGAGHAHLQVLARLARQRGTDSRVTLVTPCPSLTYSGMVPGYVAGRYTLQDCQIPLAPLIRAAGARWIQARCEGIDTAACSVRLSDGIEPLRYDLLSVDTGAVLERSQLEAALPGASEHALLVRPIERFARLWPRVAERAGERPLSVAVIGAGAAGIELVCAAQQRLPGSRFTLVTGGVEVADGYPAALQARVLKILQQRHIAVVRAACTGVAAGRITLAGGASLACDVPVVAIGTHAPAWLAGSGLALDAAGHVLVNAFQQSSSHANVFAAGDVASRVDHPHGKSGVYAVRAGPALATNLAAALAEQPLQAYRPPRRTLNLLSCGTGYAIASWGPLSLGGRWVWRWKDTIDRRFVQRYGTQAR
ncbi:MAG: FAD-dependent oxidoreductase [Rhodoferax sp.]|nr:FAD-dependent oxidoreductase [Rhodoferax sp.]